MKEKQRIRWSDSGQIPKNGSIWQIASEAILDAVIVLMFLLSARSMLHDVFAWRKFSGGLCVVTALAVICVSVVMSLSELCRGKRKALVRVAVLLGGLLGFLIYYFGRTAHSVFISTGLREVFSQYVDFWNEYYETNILTPGGIARNIPAALDFYLLLMAFVLFWAARLWDKKLIMGILPALAFGAELLVGFEPKIGGLLLVVFGIVLCNAPHFKLPAFQRFPGKKPVTGKLGNFSWLPVLLVAVLLGNLLVKTASPLADTMIANSLDIHKTIRQWIGAPSWEEPVAPEEPAENENKNTGVQLSNESPVFKNVMVIALVVDEPAQRNVYLKEFSAGKYVEGRWEADTASFETYFLEKGYDPSQVAEAVLKREVNALAKAYGVEQLGQSPSGKPMRIHYFTHRTEKKAIPYFADFAKRDDMGINGESYYTGSETVTSISAYVWDHQNRYQDNLLLFEDPQSPLILWGYDDYVQSHYLEVPGGMTMVKSLAASIISGKQMTGSENALRLLKASLVADWLEENTAYSLDLPALPEGADVIEYFLSESKQGYCVHYASAAAMLLRQMGVPARIATGYIAPKEAFVQVDAKYITQVEDNQAHAWVEVYLDGLGWFPVEVTKGYRTMHSITPSDYPMVPIEPPVVDPTEPTEEPTDPPEDDPTIPTEQTVPTEETTGEDPTEGTVGGSEGPPGTAELKKYGRWAVLIVGAVLLTAAAVAGVLKLKRNYRDELRRLISRQKMSLAIWLMNRRIYRKLRTTGKIMRPHLRDDGYEELLKKYYPEIPPEAWERYMSLAKAAAFSRRDFSREEVTFCYEIYRKVKPHS